MTGDEGISALRQALLRGHGAARRKAQLPADGGGPHHGEHHPQRAADPGIPRRRGACGEAKGAETIWGSRPSACETSCWVRTACTFKSALWDCESFMVNDRQIMGKISCANGDRKKRHGLQTLVEWSCGYDSPGFRFRPAYCVQRLCPIDLSDY